MSVYLEKNFGDEPDLLIVTTEKSSQLVQRAEDLIRQVFVVRGVKEDDSTGNLSTTTKEDISKQGYLRVEMHVYRSHLILASPFFKNLLAGGYREAEQDRVNLTIDHIAAFAMMMSFIHWEHPLVKSLNVDLNTLCQICFTIDYFKLHKLALLCADTWFEKLKVQIPRRSMDHVG